MKRYLAKLIYEKKPDILLEDTICPQMSPTRAGVKGRMNWGGCQSLLKFSTTIVNGKRFPSTIQKISRTNSQDEKVERTKRKLDRGEMMKWERGPKKKRIREKGGKKADHGKLGISFLAGGREKTGEIIQSLLTQKRKRHIKKIERSRQCTRKLAEKRRRTKKGETVGEEGGGLRLGVIKRKTQIFEPHSRRKRKSVTKRT